MIDLEGQQRAAVIKEAMSWLGTPYHHAGRLKGVGVDCAMILAEVYHKAGVIPYRKIANYPRDWHLNRSEEIFKAIVEEFAHPIPLEKWKPGDIALWKVGRCYAHAGIIVDWPVVIHAYVNKSVTLENYELTPWLQTKGGGQPREMIIYSHWGAAK